MRGRNCTEENPIVYLTQKSSSSHWRWCCRGSLFRTSRLFPFPRATAAQWKNSVSAAPPSSVATAANPILLYRNENPYGPSEKVLAVLRESAASGNRYPRTEYDSLVDKLAALHKVKSEQIVVGCGSGEILCMAALAFLKPGKKPCKLRPRFPRSGGSLKLQPSKSWTFRSTNAMSTTSG